MLDAGILQANTRLRRSDNLAREIKFAIILPKKHPVIQLIVKYHHKLDCHEMGVNYTLNHLREKYHLIHSHREVKRCIQNCYECKRRFPLHPAKQQMAPLGDDLQTFNELCYRLRWAIPDDPRMGTSSNKEILVSVPLPPNALLSFGNGHSPRHHTFLKHVYKNGSERTLAQDDVEQQQD